MCKNKCGHQICILQYIIRLYFPLFSVLLQWGFVLAMKVLFYNKNILFVDPVLFFFVWTMISGSIMPYVKLSQYKQQISLGWQFTLSMCSIMDLPCQRLPHLNVLWQPTNPRITVKTSSCVSGLVGHWCPLFYFCIISPFPRRVLL